MISFSGTREGMSEAQKAQLEQFLLDHKNSIFSLSHGGCVGADAECHAIARRVCGSSLFISVHPSTASARVVIPPDADHVADGLPPLERNRDVVRSGKDLLIVAPLWMVEVLRSGTWSTVRYARFLQVPVLLLERCEE
jgi:hypothetical protein